MKRLKIDADKCNGCLNCNIACMQAHRADAEGSIYDLNLLDPSNESRNTILLDAHGRYIPLFCRHCDSPDCAAACMSGALTKDPVSGHVLYDVNRCAKCFMCVLNCRYGVLKQDRVSGSFVVKCDFCADAGSNPNCAKACANKALYVEEV